MLTTLYKKPIKTFLVQSLYYIYTNLSKCLVIRNKSVILKIIESWFSGNLLKASLSFSYWYSIYLKQNTLFDPAEPNILSGELTMQFIFFFFPKYLLYSIFHLLINFFDSWYFACLISCHMVFNCPSQHFSCSKSTIETQRHMWNMFKVANKNTRTESVASL